ncbi:hypothetical protein [Chromohalobacter israelensis]|uniref:hypothetical protein n=1 Tax=Chromohalobacter israelensis TaxID=141390 RepID=UPI00265C5F41|nr:hypothetical protein [Chromohalobacter salexigens]MDO0944178.1 hypothetical protein [Chromohalobacter salexigens]
MGLTNYALEQMGFERIPSNLTIEARFQSINVYEARGIVSDKNEPLDPALLKKTDDGVSFSIGDSVNDLCQILAGDNFADDEEKWRAEKKATPPYLLVLTEAPEPVQCVHGYWKQANDEIITYDCFTEAKDALARLENKRASVVVTALTVLLSNEQKPVFFVPVAREVFAETNLGKRLRDFRPEFSAEGYGSSPIVTAEAAERIESALQLSRSLHPKVGYFFGLAIKEKDRLKKFLYLFLVIEIHTHQTFKGLDYSRALSELHVLPDRIANSAADFYIDRQKEAKNLTQRFMWCSILSWREVGDNDVRDFKAIKRIRDRIYHGEEVIEETLPIAEAQSLATKLMRCIQMHSHMASE